MEAGKRLAEALLSHRGEDGVVLAIPRGGVVVGREVALALGFDLDVVVPRKLGAPHNPELAIGAVGPDGSVYTDEHLVSVLGVSSEYIKGRVEAELAEARRREAVYRRGRPPVPIEGRVVVVVDDGMATGSTATAALRAVRGRGAARVVLAVPVAPPESLRRMALEADEVVCLLTPEPFYAVGEWYEEFSQLSDEDVVRALELAGAGGG